MAATSSSAASASSAMKAWRTAFLTLRDEAVASPPPDALSDLLNSVVLSQSSEALSAAAVELPVQEVVADVVFLAELSSSIAECNGATDIILLICRLIHNISCKIRLEFSSTSWTIMLNFFVRILESFRGNMNRRIETSKNPGGMQCMVEVVQIIRCIFKGNSMDRPSLLYSETICFLLDFVLSSCHLLFTESFQSSLEISKTGRRDKSCITLWELYTVIFSVTADVLSRYSPLISPDTWQFTLEIMNKILDAFALRKILLLGHEMSRFYVTLLDCLHLVLSSSKTSSSEHVSGLVVGLTMFLTYGLNCESPHLSGSRNHREKNSGSMEAKDTNKGRYIPPHLRKISESVPHPSDSRASNYELTSSDSDLSDSDRAVRDSDRFRSSKARISALTCIQDLCRSDPKSLTSIWGVLLPIENVLQPRKHQETLMSCLLFDPFLKIRISAASVLSTILESNSLVFLQVATYKESSKCGSFTTLSSSLGLVLLQVHRGILYLIRGETNGGLLASVFKILVLLISATPYSRMPEDLLPTVITTISERICAGPTPKGDQTTLMGAAFNCLAAALSTSPSPHVDLMLSKCLSQDVKHSEARPRVIAVIFQFSRVEVHPTIRFEALQAFRALLHNYPNASTACWVDISTYVLQMLQSFVEEPKWKYPEDSSVELGNAPGLADERNIMAAIKVLDEGLRATSGFQGTDDLLECRLLDIQLLSENKREKRVSSAPSYGSDMSGVMKDSSSGNLLGAEHWSEVIDTHLPLILSCNSSIIRAAGITCFSGMTSSTFFSLESDKQDFILSSLIFSALNDEAPAVRSSACRGIGVISSFPQVFNSSKLWCDIFRAVESNTRDPQISVRIASSWALANICDSLRHRATEMQLETSSEYIGLLFESALRLSKDSDKIKSNAVRALGNLSRFVACPGNNTNGSSISPDWLERMIQTFVSCVTTGNVKVQWNVCHALGNVFLNESLKLQDVPWAPSVYSILLLLLRSSTNYKIRIHAAVALAVPESREDYGSSFSDILQSVVHALECLMSGQVQDSSSFKYRDALEKQLSLTTLHILGLSCSEDDQVIIDFLAKKASFLEQWLSSLSNYLQNKLEEDLETLNSEQKYNAMRRQMRREMITNVAKSLSELYENSSQSNVSKRLKKLFILCS